MPHVVIVGAGISGLATAFRLQQLAPNLDITVLEQRDRPGGVIWTERRDGFAVEAGPNGFLDNKPSTLNLCRDLGLGHRLIAGSEAARKNRFLFLNGRLRALPVSLVSFLRSDLLSWRGKLALLSEPLRRCRRDARDESVAAFARRRAGAEVAELFADALVTGIHGGDPALLSVGAAFPRIALFEKQYGSVVRGMMQSARSQKNVAKQSRTAGQMWSFREGLRLLIETLQQRLTRPPIFRVAVRRLVAAAPNGNGSPRWTVAGEGQDRWDCDAVVLACPAYRQAAILADLDAELAERIGGIAYNRIAVIGLGFRREDVPHALNGFGYIVPQRGRRDVLGVQWCSSIYPERAPAGAVLVRAMAGGWHRADVAGWDDERLIEAVRSDLRLALGVTAAPIFQHIVRWDRAIPQYHLGHLERVAWIEQRVAAHRGLFLTGNAYHGVALNDCVEQAEIVAQRVGQYLPV